MQRVFYQPLLDLGQSGIFLLQTLWAIPQSLLRPRHLIAQLYFIGNRSMIIVAVAGMFVGMVLALGSYNAMAQFNAEDSIGALVGIILVREIGPVLAALLFAGRAGSALAAELGLMRATEQIDALELMAVDPIKRLIAPRLLAGIIALPILAIVFEVMSLGVAGAHLIGVDLLGVDTGSYWSQMRNAVDVFDDTLFGLLKAAVFGILVTWIAVYQGYHALPTAAGVGRATTKTVVISSLVVLGSNYIMSALFFAGF